MATDLTIEVLREIRDGVRDLRQDMNTQISELREEVSELREEVSELRENVNTRLGRVEHGLNDLGTFMRSIALDQARHERFHTHHVERLESDVDDLKTRVTRLEQQADPTARA
jgi:predicted nuclease with TOPRIM domain